MKSGRALRLVLALMVVCAASPLAVGAYCGYQWYGYWQSMKAIRGLWLPEMTEEEVRAGINRLEGEKGRLAQEVARLQVDLEQAADRRMPLTPEATLIDDINRRRACHILTIEDPVEYLHANKQSLVHQREVRHDVGSFAEAVRDSLREDPDVVLVGEMRDVETMRVAIVVAETGHLVFSTLHCGSAVGALDRIIGAFPADERHSLCQQLSMTLRAVVAQHLLPRADGSGRVPAAEVLRVNKAVANLVRNHRSEQIYAAMEGSGQEGMQTLEQSLAALVAAGTVRPETARGLTENVHVLERRLAAVAPQRAPERTGGKGW